VSLPAKLLTPPVVVLTLLAGVWFLGAVVAPTTMSAIGLGAAWFAICIALCALAARWRRELRWWLGATLVACAVAGLAGFWWTTIRESEFNEPIPTGVPASQLPAGELGPVDPLAPQPE